MWQMHLDFKRMRKISFLIIQQINILILHRIPHSEKKNAQMFNITDRCSRNLGVILRKIIMALDIYEQVPDLVHTWCLAFIFFKTKNALCFWEIE